MNMKKRLLCLTPLWIVGFLFLGLAACTNNTIVLYEGKWTNHGVDILVSSQYGKKEILVRDAVEVMLYEDSYMECIRVYTNPLGDKKQIALARCGSGIGFRVVMRTEMVEAGWSKRDATLNDFMNFDALRTHHTGDTHESHHSPSLSSFPDSHQDHHQPNEEK